MDPPDDEITILMDQLLHRLPAVMSRRSMRDHRTVRPVPVKSRFGRQEYIVEDAATAAKRDMDELLADPEVQLMLDFSAVTPVQMAFLRYTMETQAIMARAVMEDARDKYIAKSVTMYRFLAVAVVLVFLVILISYQLLR